MKELALYCSYLILHCSLSFAQQELAIDSLIEVTQTASNDTSKINAYLSLFELTHIQDRNVASTYLHKADSLLELCRNTDPDKILLKRLDQLSARAESSKGLLAYYNGTIDKAIEHYSIALKMEEKNRDPKGIADICNDLAFMYGADENVVEAERFYLRSLEIRRKINDKIGIGQSLNNLGHMYKDYGRIEEAINMLHESLTVRESIGDKNGIAICLNNLAIIFVTQKEFDKAIEYQERGLAIRKELDNPKMVATCLNSLGVIYYNLKKYSKALDYYNKSYEIRKEINELRGLISSIFNIANVFYRMEEYDKAIGYYFDGLEICRRTQDQASYCQAMINLASGYYKKKNIILAKTYADSALMIAKKIKRPKKIKRAAGILKKISVSSGDYKTALEMYELYIIMKDSITNEKTKKAAIRQQMKYEYEKKEALMQAEQEKKEAVAAAESKRQKVIIWAVSSGLLLLAVFAFFIVQRLRITRMQKNIIQQQKALVDEKNKNITDSIRYAKEIQEAILPTDEEISELLPESFVLFKPKDIVSGDFYWVIQTKNNKVIWVAADCTGHGVPGAFMSMIGNALLNEIVIEKGITEPAQILNELKTNIINSLSQTGESGEHRDGMDIALCALDKKTNTLEFAGANNPLFLIRKGELIETKADRQPIGYEQGKDQPFTNHEIQLQKGDTLYTFSDGYADQYGGDENSTFGKGKKFSKGRFKKLVLSFQEQSLTEQKETFDTTIESYKGDLEQVDDILVIGVRI